jgi:hypothetical protein
MINQREILEDAFRKLLPKSDKIWEGDVHDVWTFAYTRHHEMSWAFQCMIDSDSFVDAALLILREVLPGWLHSSGAGNEYGCALLTSADNSIRIPAKSETQAIAIIAAIMEAKDQSE